MGVERYLIGATLRLVVAQRLARKLCMRCRESYQPDEAEMGISARRGPIRARTWLYRAAGCEAVLVHWLHGPCRTLRGDADPR